MTRETEEVSVAQVARWQGLERLSLHGQGLIRVSLLSSLSCLRVLDLSSNQISDMNAISGLVYLTKLNLANNNITSITGLSRLFNLKDLNLSYNHINDLAGFIQVHGPAYALFKVDLKGNDIESAHQLTYLAGCTHLSHLILTDKLRYRDNPICSDKKLRENVFSMLTQIKSLDGTDMDERLISEDLNEFDATLFEPSQSIRVESVSPVKSIQHEERFVQIEGIDRLEQYMATMVDLLSKPAKEPSRDSVSVPLVHQVAQAPPSIVRDQLREQLEAIDKTYQRQLDVYRQKEQKQISMANQLNKKIKYLQEDLTNERKVTQKMKTARSQLEGQVHQIEKLLKEQKTKYDDVIAERDDMLDDLEFKLEEAGRYIESMQHLEKKCAVLQQELEQSRSNVEDVCDWKIKVAEKDKKLDQLCGNVGSLKSRITDLESQLQSRKNELDQLQNTTTERDKQIAALKESILKKDSDHALSEEKMKREHQDELHKALESQKSSLEVQHKREMREVLNELDRVKESYRELEIEFMSSIDGESHHRKQLEDELKKIKHLIKSKDEKCEQLTSKNKEMSTIIQDLTAMVKSQKTSIQKHSETHQDLQVFCQKQIDAFEVLKENNTKLTKTNHSLQAQVRACHKVLKEQQEMSRKSREELVGDFEIKIKSKEDELLTLKESFQSMEDGKRRLERDITEMQTKMRAKEVTLEERNNTIVKLKQNLENKTKDQQGSIDQILEREKQLAEELRIECRANEEFRHRLMEREAELDTMEEQMAKMKSERDDLRVEVKQLSQMLKERNLSLTEIEKEVSKVKIMFSKKEEKRVREHQESMETKDAMINELTSKLQTYTTKFSGWDRERDALLQSHRKLQKQLELSQEETKKAQSEVKHLLHELETQKKDMTAKMNKLKTAFLDLS